MTRTEGVAQSDRLYEPFVGHLPGYRAAAWGANSSCRPDADVYNGFLMAQWRALLNSPDSQKESLVHQFLERHPSLLPGSHSVDGDSGHSPFPRAVISKPKLPGLSDREPDFMWLATDSGTLYPILIEIETPHKKWFHQKGLGTHSDLTRARDQLIEWRSWFNDGNNRAKFITDYGIPPNIARRRLDPRFVLIHGRRSEFEGSPTLIKKYGALAGEGERLMSFDRLTPAKDGPLFSCVRRGPDGYSVVAVPPSLTIINQGDIYQQVAGWREALDGCLDMADQRRDYLKDQLQMLIDDPNAYVTAEPGERLRTLTPRWL